MRTTITAQQSAFYTKNGYIEFEQNLTEIFPLIRNPGRDLWRHSPPLQNFLLRKLAPIALTLSGKTQLRLGCDQLIPASDLPKKAGLLKELLSLQNLALAAVISEHPTPPKKQSPLGILPQPTTSANALFFKPTLILDWPHTTSAIYLAVFTLPNAVYAHNPHDPQTNYLKPLGYNFGDVLKNEFHPLIF